MKWTELGKVEFVKEGIKKVFNLVYGLVLVPFIAPLFLSEWLGKIAWEFYYIISSILLIVMIIVIPNYISIRRKYIIPFKNWTFNQSTGIWSDGEFHYCPSCKAENKVSPMKASKQGWKCMVKSCGAFFDDPEYKAPQPPRTRRSNWMDGY